MKSPQRLVAPQRHLNARRMRAESTARVIHVATNAGLIALLFLAALGVFLAGHIAPKAMTEINLTRMEQDQ